MKSEIQPSPAVSTSTNWLKIFTFIVLGLLVVTGSIFIGIQIGKTQISSPKISTVLPTTLPTQAISPTISKPIYTLTSIDNTWNLYTNNQLGFSMQIPKTTSEYGGSCVSGKLSNSSVPVKIFNDNQSIYITTEYFYEFPVNNICQKTINSLNIVDQRANQWKNGGKDNLIVPKNWHIITANINNDSELENFIKINYGSGCKLGSKSLSPAGVYDVKVDGDGLELDVSKCPINYIYALKYSPEFHKIASWGIGQEVVFSSDNYKQSYDADMVNSFKFVD